MLRLTAKRSARKTRMAPGARCHRRSRPALPRVSISRPRHARPKSTSRAPSRPRMHCKSVTATDRCIIFTGFGERHDHTTHIRNRSGATLAGAVAAPSIARAQTQKWRIITSWPRRLPGPGMSAERVADRVRALSGGKLEFPCRRPEKLSPPSKCWVPSATALRKSVTPLRFIGKARCRRRPFSPRCPLV